ncbi:hypothetical protein MJD09_26130, partial [bacterium]|nr:hypothetical protein [bacterium]
MCFLQDSQSFGQAQDWQNELLSNVQTRSRDGLEYVALQELADQLQVQTYYSNKVRKAILYFEEKVTVTAHNPFVIVGQSVIQLPVECQFFDGDIHVPVNFFLPIVKRFVQLGAPDFHGDQPDFSTSA